MKDFSEGTPQMSLVGTLTRAPEPLFVESRSGGTKIVSAGACTSVLYGRAFSRHFDRDIVGRVSKIERNTFFFKNVEGVQDFSYRPWHEDHIEALYWVKLLDMDGWHSQLQRDSLLNMANKLGG